MMAKEISQRYASMKEVAAALTGNDLKRTRNLLFRGSSDLRECLSNKGVTP